MSKKTKKREKKLYFSEREEKAVVDYINSESVDERHAIYNNILYKPFQKMAETILRRYPIHIGNYETSEIEANAMSHLLEHMVKYNSNKITKSGEKAKAFSYCQTIVRNFYKDHSKKSYGEKTSQLCWDDFSDDINKKREYSYELEDVHKNELEELIEIVLKRMRDKIEDDKSLKKNEIIVGEAIINVLSNWHLLFLEESPEGRYNKKVTNNFAKNKILLFLKEQTDLTTKEIRMSMKPYKEIYYFEKTNYFNDDDEL